MRFFTQVVARRCNSVVVGDLNRRLATIGSVIGTDWKWGLIRFCMPKRPCSVSASQSLQDERRLKAKDDWEKNIKTLRLKVCGELYSYWNYREYTTKKPVNGIEYDVVYADTWPKAPLGTPVVIGLHGTSASHLYFSSLASYMAVNGVRFIVPNFPGCGFTQMDKKWIFGHSPMERAAFASNLLEAIGVSRVNVVVAHSAGAFPGLVLTKDQETFQSLALINPGAHQMKWITKQAPLYILILRLIDMGIPLRWLVYKYVSKLGKKLPGGSHGAEQFEVGLRSMLLHDYDEIYSMYQEAKWQRLPLVYAYSKNDRVFSKEMFAEMSSHLEMESHMFHYDETAQLVQAGKILSNDRYGHGLVFDKGGHAILHRYPKILEEAIFGLLTYVRETRKYPGLSSIKPQRIASESSSQ